MVGYETDCKSRSNCYRSILGEVLVFDPKQIKKRKERGRKERRGKGREGKERKNERKGKERRGKGKEREGKERKKERKGEKGNERKGGLPAPSVGPFLGLLCRFSP